MQSAFSLSTSWKQPPYKDGASLVEEIRSLGFETIELGFALPRRVVEDIARLKERGLIRISSLHNMCPIPDEVPEEKATPDYYSLASTDAAERAKAVEAARSTIRNAESLSGAVVILHAGAVQMTDRTRELASAVKDKKRFDAIKSGMLQEREEKKAPHLESVIKSLRELIPYASAAGVRLALETRYYHREIPSLEEFDIIFGSFKKADLFYWHDTGHAEVHERLGLARHKDFLEKFHGRLIGMHLHDIIGEIRDHQPPGRGTFDFGVLKKYLRDDTVRVIEVHQPASGADITESVRYLTEALK